MENIYLCDCGHSLTFDKVLYTLKEAYEEDIKVSEYYCSLCGNEYEINE